MHVALNQWKAVLIVSIFIIDGLVWYAVWREAPTQYLTVAFLDIGQGDAIYIESPVHNRMLIDAGPPRAIMGKLSALVPFYTRTIDTALITNPDADHYSGFLDILHSYSINCVIEPGTNSDTERYAALEKEIASKHIPKILARRGQIFHLGGGADVKILFPDRDVSKLPTNEGSIIAELTYGSTSVMFTGDAPTSIENYEAAIGSTSIKSDILKIAHHGSKNSTSELFYQTVNPKYAVISVGKNNRYGHPHKETIDLLNKLRIPYFLTSKEGTITLTSDGKLFTIQTEK